MVTDQSGVVVWRWEPRPFGDSAANEDPDGDGSKLTFNLRFPGQYFDAETGLHYNYFRYYDPKTGRYISSDPIGLAGGVNTYGYVNNNPANDFDRFGLINDNVAKKAISNILGKKFNQFNSCHLKFLNAIVTADLIQLEDAIICQGLPVYGEKANKLRKLCKNKTKRTRQKGDRFKSDDDAILQLEEIENAQKKVRKGKANKLIDDIGKSKQRAKDAIKPHNLDLDNLDDL